MMVYFYFAVLCRFRICFWICSDIHFYIRGNTTIYYKKQLIVVAMQAIELAKQLFQNKEIRVFGTPDQPLFIASDIGDILDIKNIHTSIAKFEDYKKSS